MRTSQLRLTALLAGAALIVAIGSAIAAEGDGSQDLVVAGSDQELVAALIALQPDVPELLPSSAELASSGVDALLSGSFSTARADLDAIEDDLRALYIQADSANTAVGDAISMVTRGLLIERQGLLVLEETDDSSNPRPLDSSDARDEDGTAIDADGPLGLTFTGLDLLSTARQLQRDGYAILRDLPPGVDETGVLAARHAELVEYRDSTELTLRVLAGQDSEQLLVPVTRYDSPLGVAQAVGVTYVCVDRDAYLELNEAPEAERIAGSVVSQPDEACVEAARRAGLGLDEQVALDAQLDGVDTAVGTGGAATSDT